MKPKKVNKMGMDLDEWRYKSCLAICASKDDWATLYMIESKEQGKGYATHLLKEIKKYYENKGLKFGGSIALNNTMSHLYKKLCITEYKGE